MLQFDESMIRGMKKREDDLNEVYKSVLDRDPVQTSRVMNAATKLNVHPMAIENDLKTAEEVSKMPANEYWDYLAKQRPITYNYLSDPVNMAVSKDIIQEHDNREGFFQQIRHGYRLNDLQVKQSQAGWEQLWGALTGKKPVVNEEALKQIEDEMDELSRTAPKGFAPAYFVANQVPNLLFGAGKAIERGATGAIPAGAAALYLGQMGPQVATPEELVTVPVSMGTAFTAGAKLGYVESTAILEAGSAYRDFIKLKDRNGKPINKQTAAYYALAVGIANAGLETLSLNLFLKAVPGGKKVLDILGKNQVKDMVKKKTTGKALTKAVGTWLKAGASETGTEMAQEVTNVVAQSSLEGKFDAGRAAEQVTGVVSPTLQATLANPLTLLGLGSNTIENLQKVQKAQSDVEIYRNIGDNANQSELLKRYPDGFRALVEQQTAGTPIENVYVDAEQFVTLMQSMNPEVENAAQVAANQMGFGDQLQTALDTGTKIKIPMAEWIEKTVQTEFYKKIEPHISFSEDGLTFFQAEQEDKRIQEQIKEEQAKAAELIERNEKQQEGYQAVFNDVKQKLFAAGKPSKIKEREWSSYVDKSAKLWAAHAVAESSKRGIAVNDWYQGANVPEFTNQLPAGSKPLYQAVYQMPQANIKDFVARAFNDKTRKHFLKMRGTQQNEIDVVKQLTGIDVTGYTHVLDTKQLRHIVDRHGSEQQKNQISITNDDLNFIPEVLDSPENITKGNPTKGENYPTIVFEKNDGKGNLMMVEAIVETDKQLVVKTMWKKRIAGANARISAADLTSNNDGSAPTNVQGATASSTVGKATVPTKVSGTNSPSTENIISPDDQVYNQETLQNVEENSRGFVRITPEKSIVGLLGKADASTFLHESAHIFLNDVFAYVKSGQADEEYLKDWGVIKGWLKVGNEQETLSTEQQEQFARGFEAYLFEGKAPSEGLRKAFASFRRWLVGIYRDVKGLNVEITEPVRQVMDRMLATEDEIREREVHNNYLSDLIKEKDVSPAVWKKLHDLKDKAHEMAIQQLLKPQLEELSPEHADFVTQERERVRKIIEEDVKQSPIYIASDMLGGVFGRTKTSQELAERYLKNDGFTNEGVAQFEAVAEANGFSSGDELAKKIIAAPSFVEEVNDRLEMHMAQYGDLRDDAINFKYAAEQAVRSDEQIDVLALEHAILLDLINKEEASQTKRNQSMQRARIKAQAAKRYAREILAAKPYKEAMAATSYFAAERQAAVAEAGSYSKKDYTSAAHFADQRILNHALALEALKVKSEVDKVFKYVEKFQKKKRPNLRQNHLNQIDKILFRFGLISELSPSTIEDQTTLNEWFDAYKSREEIQTDEADIPEFIRNENNRKDYRDLTLGELRDLRRAIKNIETVGHNENHLIASEDKREIEEIGAEIAENIYQNKKVTSKEGFEHNKTAFQKALSQIQGVGASHRKVEYIVRSLDGYKDQGVMWKHIVLPLLRGLDKEYKMRREAGEKITDVFRKFYGQDTSGLTKKVYATVEGFEKLFPRGLTKENVVSMALNWGNQGNKQRLIDSYAETDRKTGAMVPLTDEAFFLEVFDQILDKNDWDFVQEVWDMIDSYWPAAAADKKQRTGVEPVKIQAEGFENRHGVYRGGYYPVDYDPSFSRKAERYSEEDITKDLTTNNYPVPSTRRGFEQTRSEKVTGRPLNLSLSVIDKHLTDVIHSVSFTNATRDVYKIMNNNHVATAIEETMGKEVYKQFLPWLKTIARDNRDTITPGPWAFTERILQRARIGSSVVNMGFKFTTAFSQIAGIFPFMEKIGTVRTLAGIMDFYSKAITGKAKGEIDFVFEKSEMMRNRMNNRDRDIRSATRKLIAENKYDKAKDSYFKMTGLFDYAITVPSWIQAFNKNIDEQLKTGEVNEEMAIRYADGVIRETQGSGDVINLAAIQAGTEMHKLFTQFYSYFSVYANRQVEAVERAKSGDVGQLMSFAMYWWFMPAVVSELLSGRGPEGDDDKIKWLLSTVLKYPFGAYVILRDLAGAVGSGFDFALSPTTAAFAKTAEFLKTIPGALEEPGKLVKTAFDAGGYWFHYPSRQITTTVGNIFDAMTGESDFELRDLVFPRQQSRR